MVANASANAATAAIFRGMEEREKEESYEVFERVSSIFGVNAVAKQLERPGRDATWDAHNVVTFPNGHRAVFEFVKEK